MKSSTNSKALLSGFGTIRLLLMAFFLVAVIAPVATLVVRLFQPGALAVFSSASFGSALANSIVSALMGTLVSVALALAAAFVLTRRRIGHAEVWVTVLALPMLIPSIAHGMGLVYLFGSNGLVTNLVSGNWNIYGLPGIVLGSTLYAFPPAFLMLYDALRYENCRAYDAADIMGIPRASQFAKITLPYLAKPLASTVFATFTLIITDYGVPIMIGGKYTTLSVLMYQEGYRKTKLRLRHCDWRRPHSPGDCRLRNRSPHLKRQFACLQRHGKACGEVYTA